MGPAQGAAASGALDPCRKDLLALNTDLLNLRLFAETLSRRAKDAEERKTLLMQFIDDIVKPRPDLKARLVDFKAGRNGYTLQPATGEPIRNLSLPAMIEQLYQLWKEEEDQAAAEGAHGVAAGHTLMSLDDWRSQVTMPYKGEAATELSALLTRLVEMGHAKLSNNARLHLRTTLVMLEEAAKQLFDYGNTAVSGIYGESWTGKSFVENLLLQVMTLSDAAYQRDPFPADTTELYRVGLDFFKHIMLHGDSNSDEMLSDVSVQPRTSVIHMPALYGHKDERDNLIASTRGALAPYAETGQKPPSYVTLLCSLTAGGKPTSNNNVRIMAGPYIHLLLTTCDRAELFTRFEPFLQFAHERFEAEVSKRSNPSRTNVAPQHMPADWENSTQDEKARHLYFETFQSMGMRAVKVADSADGPSDKAIARDVYSGLVGRWVFRDRDNAIWDGRDGRNVELDLRPETFAKLAYGPEVDPLLSELPGGSGIIFAGPTAPADPDNLPTAEELMGLVLAFIADVLQTFNLRGHEKPPGQKLTAQQRLHSCFVTAGGGQASRLQTVVWEKAAYVMREVALVLPGALLANISAHLSMVGNSPCNPEHRRMARVAMATEVKRLVLMYKGALPHKVLTSVLDEFVPLMLDERLERLEQKRPDDGSGRRLSVLFYRELERWRHDELSFRHVQENFEDLKREDAETCASFVETWEKNYDATAETWSDRKVQEKRRQLEAEEGHLDVDQAEEAIMQYEEVLEQVKESLRKVPFSTMKPTLTAAANMNEEYIARLVAEWNPESGLPHPTEVLRYLVSEVDELITHVYGVPKDYLLGLVNGLLRGIDQQLEEVQRDTQELAKLWAALDKAVKGLKKKPDSGTTVPQLHPLMTWVRAFLSTDLPEGGVAGGSDDGDDEEDGEGCGAAAAEGGCGAGGSNASSGIRVESLLDAANGFLPHKSLGHDDTVAEALSKEVQALFDNAQKEYERDLKGTSRTVVAEMLQSALSLTLHGTHERLDLQRALRTHLRLEQVCRVLHRQVTDAVTAFLHTAAGRLVDALLLYLGVADAADRPAFETLSNELNNRVKQHLVCTALRAFTSFYKKPNHFTYDNLSADLHSEMVAELDQQLLKHVWGIGEPEDELIITTRKRLAANAVKVRAQELCLEDLKDNVVTAVLETARGLRKRFWARLSKRIQRNAGCMLNVLDGGEAEGFGAKRKGKLAKQKRKDMVSLLWRQLLQYLWSRAGGKASKRGNRGGGGGGGGDGGEPGDGGSGGLADARRLLQQFHTELNTYKTKLEAGELGGISLKAAAQQLNAGVHLPASPVPAPLSAAAPAQAGQRVSAPWRKLWRPPAEAQQYVSPLGTPTTPVDGAHAMLCSFVSDRLQAQRLFNPGGGDCGVWSAAQGLGIPGLAPLLRTNGRHWAQLTDTQGQAANAHVHELRVRVVQHGALLLEAQDGDGDNTFGEFKWQAGLFLREQYRPDMTEADWVDMMMQPGTWCDEIFIRALADLYNRPVVVYQVGASDVDIVRPEELVYQALPRAPGARNAPPQQPPGGQQLCLAFLNASGEVPPAGPPANHFEAVVFQPAPADEQLQSEAHMEEDGVDDGAEEDGNGSATGEADDAAPLGEKMAVDSAGAGAGPSRPPLGPAPMDVDLEPEGSLGLWAAASKPKPVVDAAPAQESSGSAESFAFQQQVKAVSKDSTRLEPGHTVVVLCESLLAADTTDVDRLRRVLRTLAADKRIVVTVLRSSLSAALDAAERSATHRAANAREAALLALYETTIRAGTPGNMTQQSRDCVRDFSRRRVPAEAQAEGAFVAKMLVRTQQELLQQLRRSRSAKSSASDLLDSARVVLLVADNTPLRHRAVPGAHTRNTEAVPVLTLSTLDRHLGPMHAALGAAQEAAHGSMAGVVGGVVEQLCVMEHVFGHGAMLTIQLLLEADARRQVRH